MLFFINPITSLVDSLSQEKALTKAYLGLSSTMTKPITNSVGEFRFYYSRFLGYIIYNLESTIAEIEGKAIELRSAVAIAKATAPTSEALVVELPQTSSTPQLPEIANTEITNTEITNTEIVEAAETEYEEDWPIPEPTPNKNSEVSTEESIAILLECETKLQLMAKKKDIGEELVKKAWDAMTLVQKNYLQLISLRDNVTKPFATLGYQLAYQPTKDAKPRSSRLIGFYLYGEKLPQADERAILIKGETEPTICSKEYLRPFKDSTPATETEIKLLEKLLSEPQESEPTAETVAANTFTGVAPSPKLPTGSETGNKPELPPSEPNVVETIISHLKLIDSKFSFQTESKIINFNLDGQEIGYIDCSDFSVATILDEKIYDDYKFDICSYLSDVKAGCFEHLEDYYIVGNAPKKPDEQPKQPNAGVQIELDLKTPEPKELPPTPTPALEVIASELKRFHPQNTLAFTYETTPYSTFLTIKHSDSDVACFEDDGSDIYEVGNNKLTFHGFTQEQISKAYDAGEAVLESLKQKKA